MCSVYDDIKETLSILNGSSPLSNTYSYVYVRTNELLTDYYPYFQFADGNVLTVASSGDHILQAVCDGATCIDAFDNNRIQLYVARLKIAAVKVLTAEKNIDFFSSFNYEEFFLFRTYEMLRDYLSDEDRFFWDSLYKTGIFSSNINNLIIPEWLINHSDSFYTDVENYYNVRKKLDKVTINFYHSTLHEILDLVSGQKYDAIFLSNVYDYLNQSQKESFYKFISEFNKSLTSIGLMAVYTSPYSSIYEKCYYTGQEKFENRKIYIYKGNN